MAEFTIGEKVEYKRHGLSKKGMQKYLAKKEAIANYELKKKEKVSKGNSYATEDMLRTKCEREIKADPGNKQSILRKYSKLGR